MRILDLLTPATLASHFDHGSLARGMEYAAQGRVTAARVHHLSELEVRAEAYAHGSRATVYTVSVEAFEDDLGLEVLTDCSCPVGQQCKHGVALALGLARSLGAPAAAPAPAPEPWRRTLDSLLQGLASLAPSEEPVPPLALQLALDEAPTHYPYGRRPELRLRPLRPGKKRGWVKQGADWRDLAAATRQQRFDPAHLEALGALAAAVPYSALYQGAASPDLGELGPAVLPLLRRALDAGVELVCAPPLTSVTFLDEPLALRAEVRSDGGAARLQVGLHHDDRLWSGDRLRLYGDPAHLAALLPDDGGVVLAPLAPPLPAGTVRVLTGAATADVPEEHRDELTGDLARLGRLVEVTSPDGSVPVPAPVLPRLRLTVRWHTAGHADVRWCWTYDGHEVALDERDPVRDPAAERALLARLPQAPVLHEREVRDVDALHLGLLELPVWRACDDVDVVEVDAPRFREAEEAPEVRFDLVAPPDADDHTDWLDLEVTVTVQGERLLLADVIAALTLGHEHLVLPSGTYLRTDLPELQGLRELVEAAARLRERRAGGLDGDGERIGISRHDLGTWAQLGDLGIVDDQAREWVAKAQALRDLSEIPRPEPTGVVSTLRSYQLDGFHWLAFLWQHGLGGILADDMGLGKTLQVLSLVAHTRATTGDPFLVVAPTSVVAAWASEAARHTPGLRVRTVTASAARRPGTIAELAADADVLVTSYTLLRLEASAYAGVTWAGLVLDEAHQVKNHRGKAYAAVRQVPAPFRLAVSGTPFENRLLELWALLSITAPGLYPSPRQFTDEVARPVEKGKDDAALARFRRRTKPFILRRTKELVAADLPPKQEQVLDVVLSPRHRKVYDTHLARERQRILGLLEEDFDRNRVAILAALTRLRQLALDPGLVDEEHQDVGSAKLDLLVEQLHEITAEGHRALVFSTFTGYLQRVRRRLDGEGIAHAYLDGSTTDRGRVVEEFRSGTAPVFLVSLKAGGVGLTLTEADYVFVLDPWWNPAAEAQAVDRAHRIGQQRTVLVYRLVASDTIEDKVMELKARKAELFAQVVDGDGATSRGIEADDVRRLFE